jgi:hypothetical protein
LRGLYQKELRDYDEELIDQSKNISLLMRLKTDILRPSSSQSTGGQLPIINDQNTSKNGLNPSYEKEDSYGDEIGDQIPYEKSLNHSRRQSEIPLNLNNNQTSLGHTLNTEIMESKMTKRPRNKSVLSS